MKGADTEFDMGWRPEIPPPALPQPLGAGYLILVARELSGLSQRALASEIGSSQPSLATLELVLGLRRPALPKPDPDTLDELGFALLGTLHPNAEDGLADFVVFREPKPWEGPGSAEAWNLAATADIDFDIARCGETDPVQPPPHVHEPQPHLPADGPPSAEVPATNEYCRRTRSSPQLGQASAVSTDAVIGRRSSNGCSQAMHTYS
jgi:hypothetical protein